MSGKAELNKQIQSWQTEAHAWKARHDAVSKRLAKANERLVRRRNGLWRRLWLRIRAVWHYRKG